MFKKYERLDEEQAPDEETNYDDYLAPMGGPAEPTLLYFYHPDHLGTSTFLTDGNGQLYQFYLNLPFGETMTERHSLTEDYETPFKFNGKELDSETSYYYYGARFYDPKTSIWLSVDPLAEKYPNANPYAYCFQNPVAYIDPDGRAPIYGGDPTKGYGRNVVQVKSYQMKNGKMTPETYKFSPAATHLLSLVSGVSEKSISSTTLKFHDFGGGGLTLGDDFMHATIHYYDVSGDDPVFLRLSSHEVGHIPQLDEYGGGSHIARSAGAYIVEGFINLTSFNDPNFGTIVHDASPLEQQADVGEGVYKDFSKFVDKYFGNGKQGRLLRLFNNNANSQKDIIERIDKWWDIYKSEKYEKIDYSDVQ